MSNLIKFRAFVLSHQGAPRVTFLLPSDAVTDETIQGVQELARTGEHQFQGTDIRVCLDMADLKDKVRSLLKVFQPKKKAKASLPNTPTKS